jgi:hypothetical protein
MDSFFPLPLLHSILFCGHTFLILEGAHVILTKGKANEVKNVSLLLLYDTCIDLSTFNFSKKAKLTARILISWVFGTNVLK